jgi:hypothetical protein
MVLCILPQIFRQEQAVVITKLEQQPTATVPCVNSWIF